MNHSRTVTSSVNNHIIPKNQNQTQPRIVRRELNFDFGQFFYPNETRKNFDIRYFQSILKDEEGNEQKIKAIVKPDATLGTLTTFDERTFYALVELWEESNRARETLFSEREIARRVGITWGRQTAKAIDDSLNRLRISGITWQGSFYNSKTKELIEIKNPFTILSHLIVTSSKDKKQNKQIGEFSFDKRVIENLNSNFSRPVRFDVVLSFESPLAQAFYNLLDRKMYGTKEYNRTTEGLLLEDLSLVTKSYQQQKIRHQKLKGIVNQLIGKPLAFGEVIESIEIDSKRDVITVKRSGGETGKAYKAKPDKLIERATTPQPTAPKATYTQTPKVPKAIIPVIETDLKPIIEQLKKEPIEAEKAIAFFKQTFESATNITSKSSLEFASSLLTSLSLEDVKKLITYAHQEAAKTNFEPQHFAGLQQYVKPYLELQEAERKRVKRYADEEEKRRLQREQDRKDRHEGKYIDEYQAYIDSLVINIQDNEPEKLEEFLEWQEEKLEEWLEKCGVNKSDKITFRKISISAFQKKSALILRLIKYFKDDKNYKFPTFWEWDKEVNQERYKY